MPDSKPLVLAAFLLLALVPVAPAAEASTLAPGAWRSYKFVADGGSRVTVLADLHEVGSFAAIGIWVLNDRGWFRAGGYSTAGADGAVSYHAQAGGGAVAMQGGGGADGPGDVRFNLSAGCLSCYTGTFHLVVYLAGDVRGADVAVDIDRGAIVAQDAGIGAFAYRSRDFGGDNVQTMGLAPARAIAGSRGVDVSSMLLASYSTSAGDAGRLTYEGPDGGGDCPCVFAKTPAAGGAGPGRYVFRLEAVGAGPWDVHLVGVDPRLAG